MYDADGREIPDPTPVAMPAGVGRPESLAETIRRMVRNEQFVAALGGAESFAEANDFDIPGEESFKSPYEEVEMTPEEVSDALEYAEQRRNGASDPGEGASNAAPSATAGSSSGEKSGDQDRDHSGGGRTGDPARPSRQAE